MEATYSKSKTKPGVLNKLKVSLPWLLHYPLWRAGQTIRRLAEAQGTRHLIITIANHFEPSWSNRGETVDWATQEMRLKDWCRQAEKIGRNVCDSDGTPFRHTNFYPGEQYHPALLDRLARLQADGYGEVEVHWHHGVEKPDTAANLRRGLEEFRDVLAERHRLLSRMPGRATPMYAFVHGNYALANSDGGRCCGVDEEMQILADTGCYADFTLPAVLYQAQVPRINSIYQCGHPLNERAPHRSGPDVCVRHSPTLPILFTGPLVFNWRRRLHGLPVPRLDDGVLAGNYPLDSDRIKDWSGAGISVRGRPEWLFIKLYCHGFFDHDQSAVIGDGVQRSLTEVMEWAEAKGQVKIHFASARETFNIALAAVDGHAGDPHSHRDYKLRPIMQEKAAPAARARVAILM